MNERSALSALFVVTLVAAAPWACGTSGSSPASGADGVPWHQLRDRQLVGGRFERLEQRLE